MSEGNASEVMAEVRGMRWLEVVIVVLTLGLGAGVTYQVHQTGQLFEEVTNLRLEMREVQATQAQATKNSDRMDRMVDKEADLDKRLSNFEK